MDTDDAVTGPVNLGNSNVFTIRELAEQLIDLVGSKSTIEARPRPQDDPMQRRPDITLMRTTLGWDPKASCARD